MLVGLVAGVTAVLRVDPTQASMSFQLRRIGAGMPRSSLRRAQPLVRDFCAVRGIPYTEHSLLQA
jgi:hypothetical protein